MAAPTSTTTYWHCGQDHRFKFGQEDWHEEASQGKLDTGELIPMYCQAEDEDGAPCMDSSSLIPSDY